MRYVLLGDAQSPHLLKWARALAPRVELWVASSRGFLPEFDALVAPQRRLALGTAADHAGGNWTVLKTLPQLARWLKQVDADVINAHYLTSHGTLAWLAKKFWHLPALLVASAWGSDVLVTPARHPAYRWITSQVLRSSLLSTSDSQHMAERMRDLGAREVLVFPFGLEAMPAMPATKEPWCFFANRGLEPIYRPQAVLHQFAAIARERPQARLIVANDGSMRGAMEALAGELGLAERTQFVGRLSAAAQAEQYGQAQWYLSLPESDSVAVSVLEAMAFGCIPMLSNLPANHELVRHGENGLIAAPQVSAKALDALLLRAPAIAKANRDWVREQGLFAPCIERFLKSVKEYLP